MKEKQCEIRRASTDIQLPFGQQVHIALGEFGYNLIYFWVTAFLTIYYTDVVGVEAGIVSGLLLLVRVFDAVNDPLMGIICDRTITKFGRYRPWVMLGGVLTSVFMIFLFNANPNWSSGVKTAYMYVFYILLTVAATICNMSYQAMVSVATTDGETRAKIAGKRQMFVNLGTGILGIIAVSAVAKIGGGNERMGYLFSVIITCVIGLPFILNSAVRTRETVQPVRSKAPLQIGQIFKCIFGNRCCFVCACCFLILGFSSYGKAALYTYYFKYVVGNYDLYSSYSLVNMIGAVTGAALVSAVISRTFKNRGRVCAYTLLISAAFYVAIYFFPAPSAGYYCFIALCGIFHGMSTALMTSTIPDCVDYSEWKYELRCDGFIGSFMSFCMKCGGALGPSILIAVLGSMDYVPNQVQSAAVQNMINASISLVPAVLYVVMAILLFALFDLDNNKHQMIVNELDDRRKKAES